MSALNQAQLDAVERARQILDEHFEAYVLTVRAEIGDKAETHPTFWNGGYSIAYGMAHMAIDDMRRERFKEPETP